MGEVWYIENTWTCTTCQHKNPGRYMNCQGCGARREAGVQDEMPADVDAAPRVTDPEMLRQATAGAHWECEYCGGQTRDLHGNCQNCGGDREDENEKVSERTGEVFELSEPQYVGAFPERRDIPVEPLPSWWQLHKRKVYIAGSIAVGLGALTWLLLWLFLPKEVHASVSYTEWRYKEELRQRVTKSGEGWRSSMPSSSFDESCHRRQRGTERCNPHKCNPRQVDYQCRPHECNCTNRCTPQANGYSKCERVCSTCYDTCTKTEYETCYDQCPVYEDWCSYKYYEWPIIKEKVTMGYDHKVYWPGLKKTGPNQRIDRYQDYKVKFERKPDRWEYEPRNLHDYRRFKQKDPWLIKVNRAGMVWPQRKLPLEA
ncbi:MAG: hypothetical protein GWN58_33135 [Anaerolineae bacterium]|nr:hypothetical protein [Thermoplasmata archaeon]NIV34120.1 hypothetical protein [Anaerolineae bacterium]NIY05971.1 hypothetical protein [Thermoplasmata archaeon]